MRWFDDHHAQSAQRTAAKLPYTLLSVPTALNSFPKQARANGTRFMSNQPNTVVSAREIDPSLVNPVSGGRLIRLHKKCATAGYPLRSQWHPGTLIPILKVIEGCLRQCSSPYCKVISVCECSRVDDCPLVLNPQLQAKRRER
jgi:hypothetical protein